jgi:hypothetical protein
MVRQLLTVTRLESGALRPRLEVVSLAARTKRAWEALAAEVPFRLGDEAEGWLAIADADHSTGAWPCSTTPLSTDAAPDRRGNRPGA